MLARWSGTFKNAKTPSASRDVIPVTSSEQVTAIKGSKDDEFHFLHHACQVVVFSDQEAMECALSRLSLACNTSKAERFISGLDINFTGRRIASSSALSVLFASEPPLWGVSAVIGQSPSPAVSTRCCNSARRQGAMDDPCLPFVLDPNSTTLLILCIMVRGERLL
ncbi:hypothetical protein F5X98DRAFT_361348 [Xylaria grammica]|nr:hypothetical protein F5X98DRAFT_361348 [Xylaria grammica]